MVDLLLKSRGTTDEGGEKVRQRASADDVASPASRRPIATGRTGEPEPPWVRSGRIIVQDTQTLSRASAPRLAFWMLWMPATVKLW